MIGTILQRNSEPSKPSDRPFIIEMNEAAVEGIAFHASPAFQPLEISHIRSQMQGSSQLQGSVMSLASKSYIDHSDVQPLTKVHACRYDECMKYHRTKTDNGGEDSPNSPLKNVFLCLVLVFFLLWIVVYAVSTQLKLF